MARVGKTPKAVKAWALVSRDHKTIWATWTFDEKLDAWEQARPHLAGPVGDLQQGEEWIRVEIRPLLRAKGRGSK